MNKRNRLLEKVGNLFFLNVCLREVEKRRKSVKIMGYFFIELGIRKCIFLKKGKMKIFIEIYMFIYFYLVMIKVF